MVLGRVGRRNCIRSQLDADERSRKHTQLATLGVKCRGIAGTLRIPLGGGLVSKVRNRMQRRRCQARDQQQAQQRQDGMAAERLHASHEGIGCYVSMFRFYS